MDNESREQLLDHMRQEISKANIEIADLRAQLAKLNTLYETTSTAGKNVSRALDEALHTITVLRAEIDRLKAAMLEKGVK